MPAPPIPTLRIDPSSISNPTDPNDPTSTTTPIAFGNYSFPNSHSHLPSNPRDGLGMQEGTSREEEMVKPRGSAVRSSGDGGYSEGGSGVGERQGARWDLDGLKEDKVEVNTCKFTFTPYSNTVTLARSPPQRSYRIHPKGLELTCVRFHNGSHQKDPSWCGRGRSGRFQASSS